MKLAGLIVLTSMMAVSAAAQSPVYQWHTFYNNSESSWKGGAGHGVATDSAGNIYVVGETWDQATFAPGGPIHPVASGSRAAFVMKLSPSGDLVWYTFYTGTQGARAEAVAVDGDGGVYVTGNGHIVEDDSHPPVNNDNRSQPLFVLKLNSFGQYQWHTLYGDADFGAGIVVDSPRHLVYVTGLKHCCTWWALSGLNEHVFGTNDMFVLALDSNGAHQWHTFWGPGAGQGYAIALDGAGNIYAGGGQNGQITILKLNGPGAGAGWGNKAWMTFYGSGAVHGIASDGAGSLYAAGDGAPNWTGPAGQLPIHPYTDYANPAIFVLKIDENSNYLRHSFFADDYAQHANSLALDGQGRLYITGHDPWGDGFGAFDANSLHDNGGQTGHYVAALNTDLQYLWHTRYGISTDEAKGIAVSASGDLYVVGGSGGSWLGDNNTPPKMSQAGGDSVFVQKFALKTTPAITWPNPAAIQFGSALGAMQLNATASVAGTFVYSPPAGTVLAVGNGRTLSVAFTPSDTAHYASAAKSVVIDVLPAPQPPSAPRIVITKTLSRGGGQILAILTVSNTGGAAAQNVQLTVGRINSTSGTTLPQALGTVAAGGTANATLVFPGSIGNAGAAAVLTLGGTYSGGSFSSAGRIALP